ncbi:transmembrane protein 272-like [Archocentrus centrarchus]|uniref:transmembrane protein 272-like n=1 Tax=Archocentrus centrarchus TaxID=63155 RepID=UPI0011EA24A9|nr:transmembrane protein 272-like [Archocentrus centrarchus]
MDLKPQSASQIAGIVVVNIIWWMVMVAAIGLGATHLGSCTVQPHIPIYLIVLGATSILSLSLTYTSSAFDSGPVYVLSTASMTVLHIFSFGWFIAGTSWVYSVYPPNYLPGKDPYCHKVTYQFAFVVTTLVWATMCLVFVCGCCFGLLICCRTVFASRHLIPNRGSFYGAIHESAGDV